MPVTQTLEFSAGTGLTLSCKLFALGSDTVVDTQTATERTNDKNRYRVNFVDVPAGEYRLNAFVGSTGGFANEVYDLTLTTATFYPRSDTSWNGSALSGARSITVVVVDTANNPVQNALVRFTRPGETYVVVTNNTGVAIISIDDGNWTVSITASGFTFIPTTLSINANASVTYTMQIISINMPPPFAGLCNVLFSVVHLGQPVANATVNAILEDENPTVNNYLVSRQINSGVTDANGSCVLTMIQFDQFTRGGVYRIKVADTLGRTIHDRRVKVPTASTANAEDLIDAR